MEEAHIRIRAGFIRVCDGDPLSLLAEELGVGQTSLKRLKQLGENLDKINQSNYIFN